MAKSTRYLNISTNRGGILLKKDLPNSVINKEFVSEFFKATVSDVCLDKESSFYRDDKDLGVVVFSLDNDQDFYGIAFPNFSSFRDYPVIGEKIRVFSYEYLVKENDDVLLVNKFYYDKIPVENNVNSDESYSEITKNDTLRDKFLSVCDKFVKKILHTKIGEKTIESRFASVIKLGYKIGNNSNETLSELKIINNNIENKESFNEDGSSIYLTSSDGFSLESSIVDNDLYVEPENNIDVIAMNSGKVIINSRSEIDLVSDREVNIHTKGSNISSDRFNVKSDKITFGGNDADNPVVLFNELNEVLSDLIDGLSRLTVVVPTAGTSSVPTNVSDFINVKMKLNKIKSKIVKIKG